MALRSRVLIGLALVVVTGAITAVALLSHDSTPQRDPRVFVEGMTAAQHARIGCQELAEVQREVKANGDKDRVFAFLAAARRELAAAAAAEPIWLSLQSGVESIDRGLRKNDAPASELGIAIARDQCRRANVFLEGSVR